jgi:hypothetical protein
MSSTRYVAANGNDLNDGGTKSTAWLHAPGMSGCSGNCASYNPAAGDSIILRGGDTWNNQGIFFSWSGSSTASIYIGVDQTWYAGSSWNRPIFTANGTSSTQFAFAGNYLILDNIEFTGLYFDNPSNPVHYIDLRASTHSQITNSYFHGWTHGGTSDNCMLIYGQSADSTDAVLDSVFDGSDTTGGGNSCYAIYGLPGEIGFNYFNKLPNAYVGYAWSFHDNLIDYLSLSFDTTAHGNMFENNTSPANTVIYNNVLRHGSAAGSNVTLWDAATSPNTDYIFNNVIYDTTTANVIDFGAPLSGLSGSELFFNNTVECGPDSNPAAICAGGVRQSATMDNNHLVGPSSTGNGNTYTLAGGSLSENDDLAETKTLANSQGYTVTNGFAPTSPTNPTVGTGLNLATTCNAIPNSAARSACLQTTTFACAYNSSNHTVSCPAIAPITRPPSGAWDIGAYEFTSSGGPPPPPTNLSAIPQ